MVVDADSFDVKPVVAELLRAASGGIDASDVARGAATWSNELVAHVVELKTTEPATSLAGLAALFQRQVAEIERLLEPLGARLLPGAMHSWMNPLTETRLWSGDCGDVYAAYDRVFDCRGHGWSNLQSVHLNLPFDGDEEFGRLHAAIRLVLPLLPAIAASSPIFDGRESGLLDSRLDFYRRNSSRIPSLTADVVPERAFSFADYDRLIFRRIYADISPFDPEGVLQDEFLNSRGAIARFSRGSIEIRVLDAQECPLADIAICALATSVIESLVAERWASTAAQMAWETAPLVEIFDAAVRHGDQSRIENHAFLELFGWPGECPCLAGELWAYLIEDARERLPGRGAEWSSAFATLSQAGPLARRILKATGKNPSRERLRASLARLAECLSRGEMFLGL